MKKSVDRWNRLALAATMTVALGLTACGRKGPLDQPPGAELTAPQQSSYTSAPRSSLGEGADSLAPAPGERVRPAAAAAPAPASTPPEQKKTFFLDFLLAK